MGSRDDQTIYYFYDSKIDVVCGCFRGNIDEFEAKVKKTYKDGIHRENYLKEIAKVKTLFGGAQ